MVQLVKFVELIASLALLRGELIRVIGGARFSDRREVRGDMTGSTPRSECSAIALIEAAWPVNSVSC